MNTQAYTDDFPKLFSIWLPILFLIPLAYFWNYNKVFHDQWIDGELGIIELLTPVMLIPGIIFGLKAYYCHELLKQSNARLWVLLIVLACIYFAGEELSWGQHIFKWDTPEFMQSLNDQGETNLHNMSSWFDQKPRLLLEIFVLIGGIVIPIVRHLKNKDLDKHDFFYWFWPSFTCVTTAILVILVRVPERLKEHFETVIFELSNRHSEVQEFYFAIFLSVYLTSIYLRSRQG